MIPRETINSGAAKRCPTCECDVGSALRVCRSAAGYYIGTTCDCGPYSRESGYYHSQEAAEEALKQGGYERSSEFTG